MSRRIVSPVLRETIGDGQTAPWRVPFALEGSAYRLGAGESRPSPLRACLGSLALVGLITILGSRIAPVAGPSNLVILYVLAVVFVAIRWGPQLAIASAVLSALLFDYFFVIPYRTFAVSDTWYLITLIGLLAVGLTVAMLAVNARQETREARRQEACTAALYSLTRSLVVASDLDQILDAIERHLLETFRRPMVILLPGQGGLTLRSRSAGLAIDESESAAAAAVFESGQPAGSGTAQFSSSPIHYIALKTPHDVVGVLGFQADNPKQPLPPDLRHLLEIFINQAALAITRAGFAQEAQRVAVLQQTDKLQKALLNTISHNLRTPLATIIGALGAVLQEGALLGPFVQRELLETARLGAGRMNQLVQNLLDMTRLEGGAARVRIEPCDVHDVVGAALEQLRAVAGDRPISVVIAPDLPFVPMDAVLIVQVLVNLLDNALKYSPRDAPIAVDAHRVGGQLQICVADSGEGIPVQELERVFDKFFRGAASGKCGGSGLGLSICKGFVEAHGGGIWAARGARGGTEMTFTLPLGASR